MWWRNAPLTRKGVTSYIVTLALILFVPVVAWRAIEGGVSELAGIAVPVIGLALIIYFMTREARERG